MAKYDDIRLASLKEGEVYDKSTGHKLTEVNGEIIEMKYCCNCKVWHPLNSFGPNHHAKDGLQSWCRDCQKSYNRPKHQDASEEVAIDAFDLNIEEDEEATTEPLSEEMLIVNAINAAYERNRSLQMENESLKSKINELQRDEVNLNNLKEREIQTVLSSNKIPPRLLFEAIQRIDNRYQFYCVDSFTGMTSQIKTEFSA